MRKWGKYLIAAAVCSAALSVTAYAGSWKQDAVGYWWQEDDGSYPVSQWKWLDGNGDGISECYYFNGSGYMAANTSIDGYQVNALGGWIVNGEVQTRKSWELVRDGDNALEILTALEQKNENLSDADMDLLMNMNAAYAGESLISHSTGNIKIKDALSPEAMQFLMNMRMEMEVSGQTTVTDTTAFYKDGWYYYDMGGQKIRMPLDYSAALQSAQSGMQMNGLSSEDPASYITSASLARDGDTVTVYYTMDGSKLMDEANRVMAETGLGLENMGMEIRISNCKAEITADHDGNILRQRMLMNMEMDMSALTGNAGDTFDLEYYMEYKLNDTGDGVKLTLPSMEGYTDYADYLKQPVGGES
ncbi:MAG: hypothetical protein Q4C63_03555 [Eubacteriales bacterium]|nr:hypothetical protein [Eubacteriales bacterium]